MEPSEAKDLIDEAIERSETEHEQEGRLERAVERKFRDHVSVLIGILAVALAIVHMAAAGAARESLLKGIQASDTFAYMQAKVIRETIYKTASGKGTDAADRRAWTLEAKRLRAPDRARHGIGQLQTEGEELRRDGDAAASAGEGYELGETALQMAIVLLSIALVAQSRPIVYGACALALLGIAAALAARSGLSMSWPG